MDYKKPQSTIVHGGAGIYPLTTADQVILADGSRLEKDGKINVDSAAESSKLGGKAPEYYIQPRNLLDNSDFRNPVNQRGSTSYSGAVYTIDRWRTWIADDSVAVNDGYITVTGNGIHQYFGADIFNDAIYTFAAKKTDGTIVVYARNAKDDYVENGNLGFGYETSSGNVTVKLFQGSYVWAALYEGSYTAETLPPYVPKGYAAELAECQRYYYRMNLNNAPCLGTGWAYRTNNRIPIALPMTMRITPTVQMDVVSNFQIIYNKATYSATNISIQNCTFNHLTLNVVADTGISGWDIVSSRINSAATIEFSADL